MVFIVTAGQMSSLDRALAPAPMRLQVSDGVAQTYAQIFRSQPNVRTVVSFLARNIAQLGLHVFKRVSDVDRERLTDHPLAALIGKPNARTTRYRLIDSLVSDLGIYDSAYWLKVRDDGQPAGVLRIPPEMVSPIGDSWIAPDGFSVRGSRGHREFPADQVVHFRGYNPDDARGGLSPIETLRRVLAEEYEAGRYRERLWRNGARFSGYLKRPANAEWSDPARERFRAGWRSQYSGGGSDVGGTPILEDGMDFVPAAVTPDQAQYIEARKLTREEVAAAYHIPLPMVGILDHATFSNITEQHKQLYQDTLGPWLVMIEEEIELQLLPDLDAGKGVYVEFNLAEKLKGSFDEQAQQLQSAVGAPWLTRNEARARMNLPQIAGGDALVVPLNVLIGGQASATDSAPKHTAVQTKAQRDPRPFEVRYPTLVEQNERELSKFFRHQGATILSQLGAKAAPTVEQVFDEVRWNKALANVLLALATSASDLIGTETADAFGGEWNSEIAFAWLNANASAVAGNINLTTQRDLSAALADDDPLKAARELFGKMTTARSKVLAASRVAQVGNFATTEAASQTGLRSKTWTVTSKNPRPSHARLNGQTVGLNEKFSIGGRWPHDHEIGDVDEIAGCTCVLTFSAEEP